MSIKNFFYLCGLVAVFLVGTHIGHNTATHDGKISSQKEKSRSCTGYTVIDAVRVVTCQGDTVAYSWQPLKRAEDPGTTSDISEPK